MRVSPTAGAAALLLIAICPARSQEIPDLNVDPVCHGIAQQAANSTEKGDPDLSFASCVKSRHVSPAALRRGEKERLDRNQHEERLDANFRFRIAQRMRSS